MKLKRKGLQEAIDYIIGQDNSSNYALEIVEILSTICPINNTLIAGLLSTSLLTKDLTINSEQLEKITFRFGIEVGNIVKEVIKLSTISYFPYNTIQAKKIFDLVLSIPEELAKKVIFIKLSYLLHNISIFNLAPTLEKYANSALEIIEIYVPLLAKLGLEKIKIELEEVCLQILQPDTREYILTHLHAIGGKNIKTLIKNFSSSLYKSLEAVGIKAKIYGRIKTPYSIWLKMLQKNIRIDQLYDILAFRIIVEDVKQCYKTLAVIHQQYPSITSQFQDYISTPKANGYQSLHTIIKGPTKKNIEIQIRTQAMNEIAQYGKAAHWQYKRKTGVIKERVSNIYKSLYQSAYFHLFNTKKSPERIKPIRSRILKLYQFVTYK